MIVLLEVNRKLAAGLAEDLYSGKLDFEEFVKEYPENEVNIDMDIDALFDLIEHEPAAGGLFCVGKTKFMDYSESIAALINKLKA